MSCNTNQQEVPGRVQTEQSLDKYIGEKENLFHLTFRTRRHQKMATAVPAQSLSIVQDTSIKEVTNPKRVTQDQACPDPSSGTIIKKIPGGIQDSWQSTNIQQVGTCSTVCSNWVREASKAFHLAKEFNWAALAQSHIHLFGTYQNVFVAMTFNCGDTLTDKDVKNFQDLYKSLMKALNDCGDILQLYLPTTLCVLTSFWENIKSKFEELERMADSFDKYWQSGVRNIMEMLDRLGNIFYDDAVANPYDIIRWQRAAVSSRQPLVMLYLHLMAHKKSVTSSTEFRQTEILLRRYLRMEKNPFFIAFCKLALPQKHSVSLEEIQAWLSGLEEEEDIMIRFVDFSPSIICTIINRNSAVTYISIFSLNQGDLVTFAPASAAIKTILELRSDHSYPSKRITMAYIFSQLRSGKKTMLQYFGEAVVKLLATLNPQECNCLDQRAFGDEIIYGSFLSYRSNTSYIASDSSFQGQHTLCEILWLGRQCGEYGLSFPPNDAQCDYNASDGEGADEDQDLTDIDESPDEDESI